MTPCLPTDSKRSTPPARRRAACVDADNSRAARSQLRAQALVPLAVTQVVSAGTAPPGFSFTRKVFNATGLAVWTRQLAGLVGSGLPLERALTALADEAEDTRQRELVAHLRSEVNAGQPFARALASAPREFDDVYRGVVAAGEQSGALGIVLERLADDLEARQELKGRLDRRDALSGDRLGDRRGHRRLPRHLRRAAGRDRLHQHQAIAAAADDRHDGVQRLPAQLRLARPPRSSPAAASLLAFSLRNEAFRERFDAGFLGLPLIGRLARGYNAARFAGTLAMLAGAGVPILKALQAAAETLSNRAMRADAMDALVQVREGAPLASALAGKKRFPGILAMFSRLGEQTGQLPADARPRRQAARRRSAAARAADGDDPRAAADRRHGRRRDADRPRRAACRSSSSTAS